jgi:hypothetical protein
MTTPYVDPQTVHNPTTGGSPPASWGDTVRDNQQLFSTPPSVKAVRTAVQSLAHNTTSALAFTAADAWDTDSFHSTTTNNTRITVPTGLGGKYHLLGSVTFAAGADATRLLTIRLNGATEIARLQDTNGVPAGAFSAAVPIMYALAAGDYIELMCYQFSGVALNITGTLSAHWVSL